MSRLRAETVPSKVADVPGIVKYPTPPPPHSAAYVSSVRINLFDRRNFTESCPFIEARRAFYWSLHVWLKQIKAVD